MNIISVNVSLPKHIRWRGEDIVTAIFKDPVHHSVKVGHLNIEGDKQADLSVHGGENKAIYAYAAEHYSFWKSEPGKELPWGMFGENLTIDGGLFEDKVCIGDTFQAGTAELIAVQPRLPCYKLGIRFGSQRFVKQFARARRFGIYFKVLKEGELIAGDAMIKIAESKYKVTIRDVGVMLLERKKDTSLLKQAAEIETLPENIRAYFQSLL